MRYLFIIILAVLSLTSQAQLSAPGMKSVRYTSYPSNILKRDPIFIYCNESGIQKGTLLAGCPKGTPPFNYTWYKRNVVTNSYDILQKSESGVSTSTLENLDEGGYKVIVSGGYDTTFVGWILFDKNPMVEAKLTNPLKNCYYVGLTGIFSYSVDPFYYYDLVTGAPVKLFNEKTFLWSSNPNSIIPNPNTDQNPVTYTPPLEDVTYKFTVNTLGCTNESSFFYESIHVKAEFAFDPGQGEAPLEVTFTDKSVRAYTYKWDFGDDSVSDLPNPQPHIYYRPGEYRVTLSVESDKHCIDVADSTRFDNRIKVDPSKLEIPNVFTPNGDGFNDYFIVESKSLKSINVEIYSKSGVMVYNFSGENEILKDWKGWDGNVNRSSSKAVPGVYYYIIRAQGWDDIIYDSKAFRGFLYLYR